MGKGLSSREVIKLITADGSREAAVAPAGSGRERAGKETQVEYIAKTEIEDGTVLVAFPDCPGCQTEGDNMEDARVQAEEALAGWLETHLQEGDLPPRPAFKGRGMAVRVPVALGLKLQLRWARADAGLSQAQLAKRLGVSQQMIGKLEHPDYEPSVSKVELVARALGLELNVALAVSHHRRGSRRSVLDRPGPKIKKGDAVADLIAERRGGW